MATFHSKETNSKNIQDISEDEIKVAAYYSLLKNTLHTTTYNMNKILINGKVVSINLLQTYSDKVMIEISGKTYLVESCDNKNGESKTKELTQNKRLESSNSSNEIYAQIPGLISSIKIKVGDKIESGDTLFLIEAMKMQNRVISEKSARIKSILIKEGEEVLKGQLLLVLE